MSKFYALNLETGILIQSNRRCTLKRQLKRIKKWNCTAGCWIFARGLDALPRLLDKAQRLNAPYLYMSANAKYLGSNG